MSLRNLGGFGRDQLRQGGGRGNGNDHLDELIGATELFIYQTPNRRAKGFDALKLFLEANECEVLFTTDVPPELRNYEAFRITHKRGEAIPTPCPAPLPLLGPQPQLPAQLLQAHVPMSSVGPQTSRGRVVRLAPFAFILRMWPPRALYSRLNPA